MTETRKIVINSCYGGFGLSEEGDKLYAKLSGLSGVYDRDIERDDPHLIQVIETLGEKANSLCSELTIVEIPADVEWHIDDYDGMEHVAENHRTWA